MNRLGIKCVIVAVVLALLLSTGVSAASLTARINTATVANGDQFQLTLTTDTPGGAMPDLAPLQEDFNVLGTSSSMQTQIINGRQSQQMSWIVTLSPKEKGQLVIPALSLAGLSSNPLTVNVVEQSAMPRSQGVQGIEIEANIAEGTHYLYQEIPLVVRIETPIGIKRAELIAPTGSDFEITPNGEDRTTKAMRDGRAVTVIERDYILRPQKAGALTIAPFVIRGEVNDPNSRRDPFGGSLMRDFPFAGGAFGGSLFDDMFNRGTPFTARSQSIALDVEGAANSAADGWFLPAKAVELKSEWQPASPVFKVGEAVTRRISILALGARPEQLPDLNFTVPNGARIYVDESTTDEFKTAQGTFGRRDIVTSVVPTQGGEVTLPEITLRWWDTVAGEEKTASVPAETLQVEGAVANSTNTVNSAAAVSNKALNASRELSEGPNLWVLVAGGGVLLLFGGLGLLYLYGRKNAGSRPHTDAIAGKNHDTALAHQKIVRARDALRRAVKANDVSKIYQAALAWRRCVGLDTNVPVGFGEEISNLENRLYEPSKQNAVWDASKLMSIVENVTRLQLAGQRRPAVLPTLYPSVNHATGPA